MSSDGGVRPVWSRDGAVVYYSHEGSIMAARLARDATLRVAARDVVVKGPFREEFDVSPDGSRFLVIDADTSDSRLVVIPNWIAELRRARRRRLTEPAHRFERRRVARARDAVPYPLFGIRTEVNRANRLRPTMLADARSYRKVEDSPLPGLATVA